jgi:hypothetical protein
MSSDGRFIEDYSPAGLQDVDSPDVSGSPAPGAQQAGCFPDDPSRSATVTSTASDRTWKFWAAYRLGDDQFLSIVHRGLMWLPANCKVS